MSVTAHYTEAFVLIRHFPRLNFRWLVVGAAFPDAFIFDRLFMFTLDVRMHRDYFFGWFHTLLVPLAVAGLVYLIFGRRPGLAFLLGAWLHVLTDMFDVLGVKLFWPFLDTKFSVGLWPWSDTSLFSGWAVYFTTAASGLFELFFLVWAVLAVRGLPGRRFGSKILQPWRASVWRDKAAPAART